MHTHHTSLMLTHLPYHPHLILPHPIPPDKPLPFMGARPGPLNAESAGGNASELLVPPSVVTQFIEEGFRYVGRIRLAHELGPRPEPALVQPPPEKDVDGDWTAKAVRCTSDGDVYVGR